MQNRKQHYLPKCYLRNFSSNEKSIWTYNKEISKKFSQSIKNAGQLENFYKVSEKYLGNGIKKRDPNFIEKDFFANHVEPEFSVLLKVIKDEYCKWQINQLNKPVLEEGDLQMFASLLGIQFLRLPYIQKKYWSHFIKSSKARLDLLKSWFSAELSTATAPLNNVSISYDEAGKSIIHSSLFSDQALVDDYQISLLNKYWVFYVSEYETFYTSDRPIIVKPHLPNQQPFLEGFNMHGAEIIFPVTSSVLLSMWDRDYFLEKETQHNKFVYLNRDEVIKYNIIQYCCSEKEIYNPTDNFDLIEILKNMK